MTIEWIEINKLTPNPKNPNKHSTEQINRLVEIILYQGWRHPIIVDKNYMIWAGHGRLLAAKKMKLEKVPIHIQEFQSEEQAYAFLVSDNAIASWAELDLSGINLEIPSLGPDFDIDLLGIKDFVVEPADKYTGDPDAVPDVPRETKIRMGDLFSLGSHRLLCGGSTDRTQVERLMNGEKADMVFTSPPYNLTKSSLNLRNGVFSEKDSAYQSGGDDRDEGEYISLLSSSLLCALSVSEYQLINLQMLASNKVAISKWLGVFSEHLADVFIWNKSNPPPAMAEKVSTSAFEFLFLFSSEKFPKRSVRTASFGRGQFSNVHTQAVGNNSHTDGAHGATFPVSLAEHYLNNLSGPLVLDIFLGSGSTLIACEKTNRRCFGMEIDPFYCQVIIDRWEKFTGKKAEVINA